MISIQTHILATNPDRLSLFHSSKPNSKPPNASKDTAMDQSIRASEVEASTRKLTGYALLLLVVVLWTG